MPETSPADAAAFHVRALELKNRQEAEAVEQVAREGLARFPGDYDLRRELAHALLMQGRYRDGFRENELRPHRLQAPPWQLPYPEWEGPLAGRAILVWGEQGIGDEIMLARYLRTLRELGAARVSLACWPQCVRAFQQLDADLVFSRMGPVEVPKHDCWVSAFSIPHRLGLGLEDVSGAAYLRAEARGRGGVGLVERGRPDHPQDAERSIFGGLLQAAVPQGRALAPAGDVQDALETLAGLDLLITVDTSWAHMAGALGVPCWVLLPFRGLDWRWLRRRSDTPWYASVRLFRQSRPGDWSGVLEEVRAALAAIGL